MSRGGNDTVELRVDTPVVNHINASNGGSENVQDAVGRLESVSSTSKFICVHSG